MIGRRLRTFSLRGLAGLTAVTLFTGTAAAAPPPASYAFTVLATEPSPAPGVPGQFLTRDFEIGALNARGMSFWAADFNASGVGPPFPPLVGEAMYIQARDGAPQLIAASGGLDPEGVTFSNGFPGPVGLNDAGDGVFAFRLLPAPLPLTTNAVLNAGVYRYHHAHGTVTTVAKTGSPAPGGGTFAGFNFGTHINNRGDVVFHGVTKTTAGTYPNPADGGALYGVGIYRADADDTITPIVVPGDPAPSGGNFNNLRNAWQNERGDIAFGGHTTASGEAPCAVLSCPESVYLRDRHGQIVSVAHRGDVAPGTGGLKFDYAFGPRMNNQGDLVFVGCLTATVAAGITCGSNRGVFGYIDGAVVPVAVPGQVIAAEGDTYAAIRASNIVNNYFIADDGDIVFTLQYDADVNGDALKDSGVFTLSGSTYEVVAKTGDSVPGGTVAHIAQAVNTTTASSPNGYSLMNSAGEVIFQVTFGDGTSALLLAKP